MLNKILRKNPHFKEAVIVGSYVKAKCNRCDSDLSKKVASCIYNTTICFTCKNIDVYNYDPRTGLRHCDGCNQNYKVPGTNLHAWVCHVCSDRDKAEVNAMRLLQEAGYNVQKNFRYNGQDERVRVGDLYIELENNRTLFIEIDDASHLSQIGKRNHLEKDTIFCETINPDTRLLRIHREDIEDLILFIRTIEYFMNNPDREPLKDIILFLGENGSIFYNKLYGRNNLQGNPNIHCLSFNLE